MLCYWNIKQNMMINSLWWISQFHYFLEFLLISWHSVTKFLNEYVIPNVHFIFKSRIYSSLPVKFVSLLPFHVSVNTPTSYLVEKQRRENSQILFFGLNHMFTQPSHVLERLFKTSSLLTEVTAMIALFPCHAVWRVGS